MSWFLPLLVLILVMIFIFYGYGNPNNTTNSHPLSRNRDRRNLHKDAPGYQSYGKLEKPVKADDEVQRYPFKGTGTQTTDAVFLDSGVYYLVCQFPNDQKLTVDLVTEEDGTQKTITTTSGYATVSFSIKNARKYAFRVQADDPNVAWVIMVRPL